MNKFLIVMLICFAGCTTMDHNKLVSPSESLYYRADELYEEKSYAEAIEQ